MSESRSKGHLGDTVVAVVTFGRADAVARHHDHLGLDDDVAVLADSDRTFYELLDLGRGSFWKVWGPGNLLAYAKLLLSGRRLQRPDRDSDDPGEHDVRQLGGDFIFDRSGALAWACRPDSPDTRPPLDEVIRHIEALPDSAP